jgi:hypothetical protein
MITWLRYVPHHAINIHLAKGWKLVDELHGTSHGNYSVLMRWGGKNEPN